MGGMAMTTSGVQYVGSALAAAVFFVACAPEAPRQPRLSPTPTPYVLAVMSQQELVEKFVSGARSGVQHVSPVLYSGERLKREEGLILKLAENSVQKSIDEFGARDDRHRADELLRGVRYSINNYYVFSPSLVGTRPDDIPVWFAFYYDERGELYRMTTNVYLNPNLNDNVKRVMPEELKRFRGRTYAWNQGLNWIRTDLDWELLKELPYALFSGLPQGLEWRVEDKSNEPAPPTRVVTASHEGDGRMMHLRAESKGDVIYDLTLAKR